MFYFSGLKSQSIWFSRNFSFSRISVLQLELSFWMVCTTPEERKMLWCWQKNVKPTFCECHTKPFWTWGRWKLNSTLNELTASYFSPCSINKSYWKLWPSVQNNNYYISSKDHLRVINVFETPRNSRNRSCRRNQYMSQCAITSCQPP